MFPFRATLGILLAALSWAVSSPVDAAPQVFVSVAGADVDSETNTLNDCRAAWPCRTLARALSVVDWGGEVVILTSGDYDTFRIGTSVSVIATPGVHAVIYGPINIDVFGVVALRGLTLRAGFTVISVVNVVALYVEDCVLGGSFENAISFAGGGRLHLRDTTIKDSGGDYASAIYIADGIVSIDRVRMDHNRHGLVVDGGNVTIRDSVMSQQIDHAVWARGLNRPVNVTIENSTITGTESGSGIIAGDPSGPHQWAKMSVSNSTVTGNATGISAFPSTTVLSTPTIVLVSNTTIALNANGIVQPAPQPSGVRVLSRGNNTLELNGADGYFTTTFSPK
jgi:hypothetical protein